MKNILKDKVTCQTSTRQNTEDQILFVNFGRLPCSRIRTPNTDPDPGQPIQHKTVGKKIFLLGPGSVEQCVADPGVLQVKENQTVVLAEQHAQPLRLNVLLHIKKHMKITTKVPIPIDRKGENRRGDSKLNKKNDPQ